MKLLEDKLTIITGADSDVAKSASRLFPGEGAKIVASDINEYNRKDAAGTNLYPTYVAAKHGVVGLTKEAAWGHGGRISRWTTVR
jgi:NAD(P)-dependent dehydrogenase (short-subunit alcohol dehydrogenase family)